MAVNPTAKNIANQIQQQANALGGWNLPEARARLQKWQGIIRGALQAATQAKGYPSPVTAGISLYADESVSIYGDQAVMSGYGVELPEVPSPHVRLALLSNLAPRWDDRYSRGWNLSWVYENGWRVRSSILAGIPGVNYRDAGNAIDEVIAQYAGAAAADGVLISKK